MAFLNYTYLLSQAQAILKEPKNLPHTWASLLACLTLKIHGLLSILSCYLKHKPFMSQVLTTCKQSSEFVECLVEAVEYVVEKVWYRQSSPSRTKRLLLRAFIRETIKTSRVFYSTVMISLLYIYRIQPLLTSEISLQSAYESLIQGTSRAAHFLELSTPLFISQDKNFSKNYPAEIKDYFFHVRNALIGALMTASKYHQDHAPTNSDWARYTCLNLSEVTRVELAFLHCSHHQLFVSMSEYEQWSSGLMKEIHQEKRPSQLPQSLYQPQSLKLELSSFSRNCYHSTMTKSLGGMVGLRIASVLRGPQKDVYKNKRTLNLSRASRYRFLKTREIFMTHKRTHRRYYLNERSRSLLNTDRTLLPGRSANTICNHSTIEGD